MLGTHTFTTTAAAWAFMRQVDEARKAGSDLCAGYPEPIRGADRSFVGYTVQVAVVS